MCGHAYGLESAVCEPCALHHRCPPMVRVDAHRLVTDIGMRARERRERQPVPSRAAHVYFGTQLHAPPNPATVEILILCVGCPCDASAELRASAVPLPAYRHTAGTQHA